jgi:hypothetical protein
MFRRTWLTHVKLSEQAACCAAQESEVRLGIHHPRISLLRGYLAHSPSRGNTDGSTAFSPGSATTVSAENIPTVQPR